MSARDPRIKEEYAESGPDDTAQTGTDNAPSGDAGSPKEIGGRGGLDPTRYGDWEKAGRCIDF